MTTEKPRTSMLPDGTQTGVVQPVEKDEFFYHGDHLGSSNMITDAYGAVYQHLEYFPYGETWIEEGGSHGGNLPGYKFTGKELDPETGLYYYGARYYHPVLSKWISADPILEKYLPTWDHPNQLPGLGGVFNPANLSLYSYVGNRHPLNAIDPNGQWALVDDAIAVVGGRSSAWLRRASRTLSGEKRVPGKATLRRESAAQSAPKRHCTREASLQEPRAALRTV